MTTPQLFCPFDSSELKHVCDQGIVDYDGQWDAQVSRYECKDGKHVLFVADPAAVDDIYQPAFDAAEKAILDSLRNALWVVKDSGPSFIRLKSDLIADEGALCEPITSLEDLRNELAHRAVFAFKDVVDEELGGEGMNKVEYEYIHAIEDVDLILDEHGFTEKLKEVRWKDAKT